MLAHRREKPPLGGPRVGGIVITLGRVGLRGGWTRRGSGLEHRRGHRGVRVVAVWLRRRRREPFGQKLTETIWQRQHHIDRVAQLSELLPVHDSLSSYCGTTRLAAIATGR